MLFSHCLEIILSLHLCFVSEIPRHGETCTPGLVAWLMRGPASHHLLGIGSPPPALPLSDAQVLPSRPISDSSGCHHPPSAPAGTWMWGWGVLGWESSSAGLSRGKPFLHSWSRDQSPELKCKGPRGLPICQKLRQQGHGKRKRLAQLHQSPLWSRAQQRG